MTMHDKTNILLVDDRPENLLALEKLLRSPELNIMKAASGNEALAMVLDHDFALILLDVQMPEMDGFETAELMRGNSGSRHIPIIFVTAISKDQRNVFKGYASGAVDYLFKPVDPDILLGKVKIFLELHQQKVALKEANEELRLANLRILEQQKHVVEEERLKVLLQMAGASAHDLNQPLTMLLGSIQIMEREGTSPERLAYHIDNIKNAGIRIAETIKKFHLLDRSEKIIQTASTSGIDHYEKITILAIEDKKEDFELVESLLMYEKSVELCFVSTLQEGFSMLESTDIHLIFLDYCLPDGTGLDFLLEIEKKGIVVPVVIITGQGDELLAAQMIKAGAYDYLPKARLGRKALVRVITNALEKARLRKEVRLVHEKMAQLSTKDELTGLFNRRFFNEILKQEISRGNRYGIDFTLCIMDLDHFKSVNDRFGHTAGDQVLKKVAALITTNFRQDDLKCRFGGEEFAVIFPHTHLNEAMKACETFRLTLASTIFNYDSNQFQMTVSIGLSALSITASSSLEEIVLKADEALYQAKSGGRNRVCQAEATAPDTQ